MTAPESSHEQSPEDFEKAPEPNGDLASWLYVIGGIPMMALFFVVLFTIVGTCDASNIMVHG